MLTFCKLPAHGPEASTEISQLLFCTHRHLAILFVSCFVTFKLYVGMGNDSGDIGQLPDFNPAVVDEQLAAWSHVNGLTTNKDPSNIPAFVLLHRARSALSCIQRALRSHGIV